VAAISTIVYTGRGPLNIRHKQFLQFCELLVSVHL
jgi:hypothetical protein